MSASPELQAHPCLSKQEMRSVGFGEFFKTFTPFPISALGSVEKIKQLPFPLGEVSSLLIISPESVCNTVSSFWYLGPYVLQGPQIPGGGLVAKCPGSSLMSTADNLCGFEGTPCVSDSLIINQQWLFPLCHTQGGRECRALECKALLLVVCL